LPAINLDLEGIERMPSKVAQGLQDIGSFTEGALQAWWQPMHNNGIQSHAHHLNKKTIRRIAALQ
jgi:hypothetical protein